MVWTPLNSRVPTSAVAAAKRDPLIDAPGERFAGRIFVNYETMKIDRPLPEEMLYFKKLPASDVRASGWFPITTGNPDETI